mmetsp:Transcript_160058/g.513510  ORF Transcript_160058/g.513510 Transcript_160058/m.513510 type:complete len:269 (-) Transcript_160058:155-961(-)
MSCQHLELFEALRIALPGSAGKELKVADAEEGRCDAGRHGTRLFESDVAPVLLDVLLACFQVRIGVAVPRPRRPFCARTDQGQCSCRPHTQVVHRLGREKLANARAEHRPAIGPTAKRCGPGAFKLQLPTAACNNDLCQRYRSSIPVAVPGSKWAILDHLLAVYRQGVGRGPRGLERRKFCDVSREHTGKAFGLAFLHGQAKELCNLRAANDEVRVCQRRGQHVHVVARKHLARLLVRCVPTLLRIRRQLSQPRVINTSAEAPNVACL